MWGKGPRTCRLCLKQACEWNLSHIRLYATRQPRTWFRISRGAGVLVHCGTNKQGSITHVLFLLGLQNREQGREMEIGSSKVAVQRSTAVCRVYQFKCKSEQRGVNFWAIAGGILVDRIFHIESISPHMIWIPFPPLKSIICGRVHRIHFIAEIICFSVYLNEVSKTHLQIQLHSTYISQK